MPFDSRMYVYKIIDTCLLVSAKEEKDFGLRDVNRIAAHHISLVFI